MATSGYDMAKSWSASIVGQVRTRTVNSHGIRPENQPSAIPRLTQLSHMPTIRESVPSDHRTKRCRRGSEPIVYGSRPCNFAAEGNVAESEESRSVRAQTLVRFSSKSFRRFSSYHLNSPKISQLKCHPSTHKNNIRNGLSTKPASK